MAHQGKRIFVTGIPTSGKSYLAKMLADRTGGKAVLLDELREHLALDERYKKWVNFYIDVDEKDYLTKTSPEKQWENLVAQSEALWPALHEEIEKHKNDPAPVVFECVNILPHIAYRSLDFPGIALVGESFEETLRRNIEDPRWGSTMELQELEARTFFFVERPRYIAESEKYGFPIFQRADDAVAYCTEILT